MLVNNIENSEFNTPLLRVRFNDEYVDFDLTNVCKRTTKIEHLYDQINEYYKLLSEDQSRIIFDIFKEISINTEVDFSSVEYADYLRSKLYTVIEQFNFDGFSAWFEINHGNVIIPEGMATVFEAGPDIKNTRKKTYLLSEYIGFVSLVLFMRAMLPVYAEYLSYSIRADKHPFYKTFRLFANSQLDVRNDIDYIDNPLYETEILYANSLDKLRTYITANHDFMIGKNNREHLILGAGLSDDDIEDYLVAESLINKLLLVDFYNSTINPISHIYQSVKHDGAFKSAASNNIKFKTNPVSGGEDDYSIFENFRKTSLLPMGTIEELQEALRDDKLLLIGLGLDPALADSEFYKNELKNVGEFMKEPLDDIGIYMLGWFLKSAVNPRALFDIDTKRLIELMLLAKTCMYHTGQEYIGTFLGSVCDIEATYFNSNISLKSSLSKSLQDKLRSMFTYSVIDKVPTYEKTVLDVSKQIANIPWRPKGYVKPEYINEDGFLLTPHDINDVIVSYIEYVLNLGQK